MKSRVVKKVEKGQMVVAICSLQRTICEYQRFLGDLLIMLSKRKPQCVLKHDCDEFADWIWDETKKLIEENAELRAKCEVSNTAVAEHSEGRAD